MKFKEAPENPVVEVSIEAHDEDVEEKCPIKEAHETLVKTYKKIIKDRIELIEESMMIIRRTLDRLYECGEDNDTRETSC